MGIIVASYAAAWIEIEKRREGVRRYSGRILRGGRTSLAAQVASYADACIEIAQRNLTADGLGRILRGCVD